MAYVVNVQPTFNNAVRVVSNDAMNGTILSNSLSAEVLLNIWNTYPEMRAYLFLQWVDIIGSYPPGTIDASLLHAYDSSEVSHNPAKMDYVTGSLGKHLNDTATIANATKNGLVVASILPSKIFDFAASKVLSSDCTFTRNSVGSYVDRYGTIRYANVNQPRFTHDPITLQSLGILLEEDRTNIVYNSVDCTAQSQLTKTINASVAPDGSNTAVLIEKNSTANGILIPLSGSLSDGFFCRSVFVKANNSTECKIAFEAIGGSTASAGGAIIFDVLTKTFSRDISIPFSYGYVDYPNGWVRVFVIGQKITGTLDFSGQIYLGGYGGISANNNSCYFWGFQIESGKSLGSYIPTTTIPLTRNADVLFVNNNILPKSEGTFCITGVIPGTWEKSNNLKRILSLEGTDILSFLSGNNIATWNGSSYNTQSGVSTYNDNIVLAFNSSLRKLTANGLAISQTTPISIGAGKLYLGSGGSTNFLNGTIKRLTIYSKILSDSDLIALSTKNRLSSFEANGQTANSGLNEAAFLGVKTLMSLRNRQEFMIHGTGASESRNIRRPYDFTFEIVDSSGVTTISAQPSASCTANSDNTLTANIPVGKSLVYAITPAIYDV